jgi:uncharacterized lipoprotein YmbA
VCVLQWSCFRGTLPPRQFYRLAPVDSVASVSRAAGAPPLTGGIAIHAYDTPGIYGSGSLVYRVGASAYATYPSREWAIPLGEMIAKLTETVARPRALTSGRIAFDPPSTRREQYEWRGTVNEFDEVDGVSSVSASVGLSAQLVRVVDDSVVWSGTAREVEPVRESQNIDSVVASLSIAATRAVTRLADDAASALRRLAASGAPDR